MLPEPRPVGAIEWVQSGISWNKRAVIRPVCGVLDELGFQRIEQHIVCAGYRECAATALLWSHYMIVSLMLELCWTEMATKFRAEEFHPVPLIGLCTQAHPDEMDMIRHQA